MPGDAPSRQVVDGSITPPPSGEPVPPILQQRDACKVQDLSPL